MAIDPDQIIENELAKPKSVQTGAGKVEARPADEINALLDRKARRSKRLRTVPMKTSAMVRTTRGQEDAGD